MKIAFFLLWRTQLSFICFEIRQTQKPRKLPKFFLKNQRISSKIGTDPHHVQQRFLPLFSPRVWGLRCRFGRGWGWPRDGRRRKTQNVSLVVLTCTLYLPNLWISTHFLKTFQSDINSISGVFHRFCGNKHNRIFETLSLGE